MPGPVALVGAGEFLPAMAEFDAGSARRRPGGRGPRVAILPTASYPDGEEVFQRWAAMGVAHFGALGAEVEPVLVRDRVGADDAGAAQAVGEADLDLPVGRQARLPARTPRGHARSARRSPTPTSAARSLAGCSAGAMVLAGPRLRLPACGCCRGRCAGEPAWGWRRASSVMPALRRLARADVCALIALQAPRGSVVLGIDEETAVVGRDGAWQVHGAARGSRSGGAAGASATAPARSFRLDDCGRRRAGASATVERDRELDRSVRAGPSGSSRSSRPGGPCAA